VSGGSADSSCGKAQQPSPSSNSNRARQSYAPPSNSAIDQT
jgi:hypothetical protein